MTVLRKLKFRHGAGLAVLCIAALLLWPGLTVRQPVANVGYALAVCGVVVALGWIAYRSPPGWFRRGRLWPWSGTILALALLGGEDAQDVLGEWKFQRDAFRNGDRVSPAPGPRLPEMVDLPAGLFTMGSPDSENSRERDEGPPHRVTIARPFALGRHEVSFDEYDEFARATGRALPDDGGWGRGRRPVIRVSWDDARDYAAWLSTRTGQAYRLPTEAEWEYAARAGTITSRYWGNDRGQACRFANIDDLSHGCRDGYDQQTAPVGRFEPNAFGLHDLLGNVWEWTADCWHANYRGAPGDGSAWEEEACESRVLRGGSWINGPSVVRAANRGWAPPGVRARDCGFRLARTIPPPPGGTGFQAHP